MSKHRDLAGQTFGYVTAIKPAGFTTQNRLIWLCRCKCGQLCTRHAPELTQKKHLVSCGCKAFELRGGSRDFNCYTTWRGIIARTRDKSHRNYGQKGIQVCARWTLFKNFLADMGEKPSLSHSIDRINTNGHYEPSNCRWATSKEQTRNSSRNVLITYQGKTQCVADWCEVLHVPPKRVYDRIKHGWSPIVALLEPLAQHYPRKGKLISRQALSCL